MACTCQNIDCTQSTVSGIVYCSCTTVISDISCPPGCSTVILEDGNAMCECTDQVTPTVETNKTPIYFDNEEYFEDVSWTISFKADEGLWNSYNTFYPDYSIGHNGFFQVGYNWGAHKETVWSHLMNNGSFCVFQGEKHVPMIEFPIVSENVNKILNSVSLNVEGVHYQNDWEWAVNKDISFKNMYIYNRTNNTGMLGLNPQKSLKDLRDYPKVVGNTQEILFTSDQGRQNVNYLFNRVVQETNNIPAFITDKNNIFKTINTNAVKFSGKKVLERLKGEYFLINLSGCTDTRYNLILKNSINQENIIE